MNPWDVQASSPIQGAINEGDVIMLMYYARAAEPAEGGSSLTARIQLSGAPYTAAMDMTSQITEEWKSYCAHRVATATLPEKKSNVSIHLATAKQVIELGPVFVFNFGKGIRPEQAQGLRWLAGPRTIPAAVRELCLAFPEAEEFESHGSPNYRALAQGQGVRHVGAQSSRRRARRPCG